MNDKPRCEICGFEHAPNNPALKLVFDGEDYYAPFFCLCCGKRICDQQFAFGRACGPCDVGACQRGHSSFHPAAAHQPSLWSKRKEMQRQIAAETARIVAILKDHAQYARFGDGKLTAAFVDELGEIIREVEGAE